VLTHTYILYYIYNILSHVGKIKYYKSIQILIPLNESFFRNTNLLKIKVYKRVVMYYYLNQYSLIIYII